MNYKIDLKYYSNRLLNISTLFLAFGINLPSEFIPKFLFIWIFSHFIYLVFNIEKIKIFHKENLHHIFMISFYIWSIATLLYSANIERGINVLESRLALLFIPIFSITNKNYFHSKNLFLKSFLFGNIFTIAFCLINYQLNWNWGNTFIRNSNIVIVINSFQHYNYIGINLSIGLVFISYLLRGYNSFKRILGITLLFILYSSFIILSHSRMSFLVITFVYGLLLIIIIKSHLQKVIYLLSFACILIIFLFFLFNLDNLNYVPIKEILSNIDKERIEIWENGLNLIKKHVLFGYGLGDSQIPRTYSNLHFVDAHNQFISFLLEGGIISLFLFLTSCFYMIKNIKEHSLRIHSKLAFIVIFLFMLVESTFNRIANIGSFIFLYNIFIVNKSEPLKLYSKKTLYTYFLLIILLFFLSFGTLLNSKRNIEFDSANPKTFATHPFQSVRINNLPNLTNLDIQQKKLRGYKLSKKAFSQSWNNNAYSYTELTKQTLSRKDIFKSSVYCFVSNDFNGDWVRISMESEEKNYFDYYNLEYKNTWQKLTVEAKDIDALIRLRLFFAKENQSNFDNLEGYVIFVYPEFNISKSNIE